MGVADFGTVLGVATALALFWSWMLVWMDRKQSALIDGVQRAIAGLRTEQREQGERLARVEGTLSVLASWRESRL